MDSLQQELRLHCFCRSMKMAIQRKAIFELPSIQSTLSLYQTFIDCQDIDVFMIEFFFAGPTKSKIVAITYALVKK
jgi:hypothetical protein